MRRREFIMRLWRRRRRAGAWPVRGARPAGRDAGDRIPAFRHRRDRMPSASPVSARASARPAWSKGENVAIEFRWADRARSTGCRRWPPIWSSRSVASSPRSPDTSAALAAKAATRDDSDRLRHRRRPGQGGPCGRASTGRAATSPASASFRSELAAKRLGLLRDAVAERRAASACWSIRTMRSAARLRERPAERALRRSASRSEIVHASTEPEMEAAFAEHCEKAGRGAACRAPMRSFSPPRPARCARSATRAARRFTTTATIAEAGGLMSYGPTSCRALSRLAVTSAASSRARSRPTCRSQQSDKIRNRHQPEGRQGTGARNPGKASVHRRRSDRVRPHA